MLPPVKKTARLLALNVPLLVKLPCRTRSPPLLVERFRLPPLSIKTFFVMVSAAVIAWKGGPSNTIRKRPPLLASRLPAICRATFGVMLPMSTSVPVLTCTSFG